MTPLRSDYPVFPTGYTRAASDPPLMLDGMEVLFDRTVGLAPATLVPRKSTRAGAGDTDEERSA